ncbi:MAG: hypothetical protein FWD74_07165 [Actinomycetia bacterium]|nr:hypothetical protein [Actinomycetes bacterium]
MTSPERARGAHRQARSGPRPIALVAAVLLVGALAALGGWRLADRSGQRAFDSAAKPPASYRLTGGKTYQLSTRDGKMTFALTCSWTPVGGSATSLDVTEPGLGGASSRVIAEFVAPASGRGSVTCDGTAAVFVDDADSAPFDRAGFLLLVGVILLAAGVAAALAAGYGPVRPRPAPRTRQQAGQTRQDAGQTRAPMETAVTSPPGGGVVTVAESIRSIAGTRIERLSNA